jgi:hypothetical protein
MGPVAPFWFIFGRSKRTPDFQNDLQSYKVLFGFPNLTLTIQVTQEKTQDDLPT